jgi:hypothetical protein
MLLGLLALAYYTLVLQIVIVPLLIAGARRTGRLWEYIALFHVCAILTVAGLALFPAECAFQYLGFDSTLSQTRFIAQFNGLRSGTFNTIDFRDLEGLISVPSFHIAGALMTTWASRGLPWFWWLIGLNSLLVTATVMTGAHYFVDVPITVAVFIFAVWFVRWYRRSTV